MKKLLALALASLMVLTMAACGGNPAPSSSDVSTPDSSTPDASQPEATAWTPAEAGYLTVGTSADFAPYEFHIMEDGQDKIVGFDMELAQYIADAMGLELKVVDIAFDSILIELNNGTIDMGIAGFSPDPERKVLFSDAYYTGTQCMMVTKANLEKFSSYTDLNKAELSVGAQTGSIQADLAAEHTPNANQVLLQAIPSIIMELKAGTVDAAFMETAVAEGYIKTQDDLAILCEVPYDAPGSCVAIKEGNDSLLEQVNAIIAQMTQEGKMDGWVQTANELAEQAIS